MSSYNLEEGPAVPGTVPRATRWEERGWMTARKELEGGQGASAVLIAKLSGLGPSLPPSDLPLGWLDLRDLPP